MVLLISLPLGAELAVFTDGRILHVQDAYLDGDRIVLTLHGGGSLKVPAHRIDRIVSDVLGNPNKEEADASSAACNPNWVEQQLPSEIPFAAEIVTAAQKANLNPRLLAALVRTESAYDPRAVSRAGAKGLTQLMPSAAFDRGVKDPFHATQNLNGGAAHLRILIDRFKTLELALAAYNSGAATVERHDGVPPYRETQQYVEKILKLFCGEKK
ncbi:MAG: transglycosylase SLT domain-containing protein [bacterium]|nr:transglycosylase SLT domain-containing protein [bacterium]